MSLDLIIIAIGLVAVSGVIGFLLPRSSSLCQWVAAGFVTLGMLTGLTGVGVGLCAPSSSIARFPWPAMGDSLLGLDALSAFFLIPVFLMGGLGSIYSLGYWPQRQYQRSGQKMQFFWGWLVAGLALLVISKHAMAFLFGWEVMALSAFFLVTTEDQHAENRKAGLIYLITTHVGTLILFSLFVLWRWATGSFDLQPMLSHTVSLGVMNALFFLIMLGFGLKAGIMPMHFWLPSAHASAPSHVSAMLSGVVLKIGIYGLLRMLWLLPDPPVLWGGLILALGMINSLVGVVFALGQHDLKRLLAYHSVENIGIILMGLGLAMLGRSTGRPDWIVLGMAGCLLHVLNHSLFKSLLFLGAGSVIRSTRTRQIDRLGGLAKTMPWTATLFLLGAVAICGLPPLNGFVSEFIVFLGLFKTLIIPEMKGAAIAMAAPVLAITGALAVACFVKVYGVVFLGTPRTTSPVHSREASLLMRIPMVILALACLGIGAAPVLIGPVLDQIISSVCYPEQVITLTLGSVVPLTSLSVMAVFLMIGIAVLWILIRWLMKPLQHSVTWDCGYSASTARMQYTAGSFVQMILRMFRWVLRPHVQRVRISQLFPKTAMYSSHVDEAVLDRWLLPSFHTLEHWFGWFRRFQQGLTQHYVLYILITVFLMLSTLLPFDEIFAFLIH